MVRRDYIVRQSPQGSPQPRRRARLPQRLVTPREEFRRLIFELLLAAPNHTMPAREVRDVIGRRLARQLTDADQAELPNGETRWVNNMQWVRKGLVMEGLMESVLTAGHGQWALTRRGVIKAQAAA